MNLENYVEDKFKHEIKKWFGIRMVQVPMNTNEGYILTKSSKIKISEAYKFIPSQVFETRITCNQKSCDLTSWFGCFYVACREIPGAELAAENAFYLAKEATRKNMEAAKQELIAEQEKEEKKEMLALEQQAGAEAEQGQTHAQWMREQPLYYPVYFAVPRDAGSGKIYQWYNPIYSSLGIQQPIQSHVQQSPYYIS